MKIDAVIALGMLAASLPFIPARAQAQAEPESGLTWAVGAGAVCSPAWPGASRTRCDPLPYLAVNWRDIVDFSTVDGLSIDFLQGESWHGGLTGRWRQGRSSGDLGKRLARAGVRRLSDTVQAGVYLEYEPVRQLTLGVEFAHDLPSTGSACGSAYAEWEIPFLKPVEHSLKLDLEFMNRSAMRRYFGLPGGPADALGVGAYRPSAGASGVTLSYEAFLPTGRSTGFALGLNWTRLLPKAADSPLVRDFGRRTQGAVFLAFVVHD